MQPHTIVTNRIRRAATQRGHLQRAISNLGRYLRSEFGRFAQLRGRTESEVYRLYSRSSREDLLLDTRQFEFALPAAS